MTNHAVVIAGAGPTGLMLAGELALARVDVAIVERRANQDLPGTRAGGLHARTIEVLDQRGIADRFLSQGKVMQVAGFAFNPLDISDFPTRHNYGLALGQERIERILAAWALELAVPIYREREVTGFAQDDTGVDVEVSDGRSLRAKYLVGCDGGRSLIRKKAGIDFPGWDPSVSYLIAEVEMTGEPAWGMRRDDKGIHGLAKVVQGRLAALPDLLLGRHHPHELAVLEFREAMDALVITAHAPVRLVGHRGLGNQVADGRVPAREVDPGFLADQATTAVASDEVLRSQRTAVGQLDVYAGVVLGKARHLTFAIDRYRQLVDPGSEYALDALLQQREPVVVASRKVADVERDQREAPDLHDLPLREEAIRDSTLIEHLDGA